MRPRFLLPLVLALFPGLGYANCQDPRADPVECGWWWKMTRPEPPEAKPAVPPPPAQTTRNCQDPRQWAPPCGFINPGSDFAFQSRQRDALMQRMVMHPNNPAAVRGFQEYNKWVLNRAIAVGRMWRWNMVQDPSLNPTVSAPTSQFGLNLLKRERGSLQQRVYQIIGEAGGFFVWFTRSDCRYCHDMASIIDLVREDTGLPIYNASLDAACMPGFAGNQCMTGPATHKPAALLEVRTVPDLFLHLPKDQQWIRVATGVVTVPVITARIKLFVGAMLAATENAVVNAKASGYNRPSVDFLNEVQSFTRYGMGEGVTPPPLSGAPPTQP